MALNDVQHVEAVALIRRIIETSTLAPEICKAAEGWLKENHPEPHVYLTAAKSLSGLPGSAIGDPVQAADEGMGI